MHLDGRLLLRQPALSQRPIAAAAGKCREPRGGPRPAAGPASGFPETPGQIPARAGMSVGHPARRQADQRGIEGGGEYPLG